MKRWTVWIWIVVLALTAGACRPDSVTGDSSGTVVPEIEGTATKASDATQVQPTPTPVGTQPTGSGESGEGGEEEQNEIPVDQRIAVLEGVTSFMDTLSGEDRSANNADIVVYLESRSEFKATGVSPDGTVWGEFTDGRLLFVFNSPDPTEGGEPNGTDPNLARWEARPSHVAASWAPQTRRLPELGPDLSTAQETHVELPSSGQVRLLNALGTYYEASDAVPGLGSLFARGNYYPAEGAEATVNGLKNVAGDGVFYLQTHGGLMAAAEGESVYGFWTQTPINTSNEAELKSDLQARRVVYAIAPTDKNPAYVPGRDPSGSRYLHERHYGITADFIREYMSFGENSFVYIMSCSSDDPEMRSAFLAKGADAYAGWSQPVSVSGAYKATMFLFDRLLGANQVAPIESPKQRPFDLHAVYANLKERGLYKVGDSELNLWTRPNESLSLMPSIAYLEVREDSDELFIYGLFGSVEGEVTINDVPTPVTHWTRDTVAVKLPAKGPGSAGDVIVTVYKHESNAVPLTEWRGEIRYSFVSQLPAPDLLTEVVIQSHFRADVHPYREEPGKPPEERDIHFVLAGDSTAEWQMTGHSVQKGATFDLEGGGALPLEKVQPDHGDGHFGLIGTLETSGMLIGNPPQITGLDFHIHTSDNPTEGILKMSYPGGSQESGYPIPQTDALYDLTLALERDFSIKAGQRQSQTIRGQSVSMMGTGTLEWEQIQASFAPDLSNLPHADVLPFDVLAAVW